MTTTADDTLAYLDSRPGPGEPRAYHFPRFSRSRLSNGVELITADLPGRPLLVGHLLLGGAGAGVTGEPAALAGATVLAARAMTEGTQRRDALALIEASERLGAEISADAGWDSLAVSVEVPRSRLEPALTLLAEVALEPSFPADEVERLRDERLNDLLQARAEPRRRVERAFAETVYAADAAYRRPAGGSELTVPALDRDVLAARHAAILRPSGATLIVAGDLTGIDVRALAERGFGGWQEPTAAAESGIGDSDAAAGGPGRVVVVHRPGSPQSELRIGHVGTPRRTPDFHAVSVLNAVLGGLFGSRLNALLREEKGYTYGVHSSFDMRVGAGPFGVRTAVQTEFTVPAIVDTLAELRRIRETPAEDEELAIARDYLVGVFPLRYESSGQVAGAIAGLVAHGLPDDELDRYRPAVAAVTPDQVLEAAQRHIRPDEASVVVVGDADAFLPALEAAGVGAVEVVREEAPEPEG
ncbi:MAG: insulinase family protein [Chloroflexi bacterium]|nr:insulinase family protein [Chloroflexota bacterium]